MKTQTRNQKTAKQTPQKVKHKRTFFKYSEDQLIHIHISNKTLKELKSLTPQKPSTVNTDEDNKIGLAMNDSFDRHLIYPEPIQLKHKNNKDKLPSAISSAAWRRHFQEQDRVKREKAEEIAKKKQIRILAKAAIQAKLEISKNLKRKNAKTTSGGKIKKRGNSIDDTENIGKKQKVKCASCEEELESDTEIEDDKNIGCDKCTNWYHMKCTEFYGLPYEEAATQDYICFCCS